MAGAELTIDELAAQLGMTTRNIRAYQAKGLLQAPELRGRTGFYGPEHVERLELVRRLQAQGMNLATIAKFIASEGGFASMVLEQFAPEEPYEVARSELADRFGADDPEGALLRADQLDLVDIVDDQTVIVRSPTVLRRADELVGMGIPVESQLDAVAVARRATLDVADAFVRLAAEHLIEQVDPDHLPDAEAIGEEVQRLGALATDVVHALFREALASRIRALLE